MLLSVEQTDEIFEELAELTKQVAIMKEALLFYAEQKHLSQNEDGQVARDAIDKLAISGGPCSCGITDCVGSGAV